MITFVCFQLGFGLARTGFACVILIALVSLLGSFAASVALSILAAACLNYFFAPPLFQLGIDAQVDVVRIAAFLTTSLVVTALTARLKRAKEELAKNNARFEEAQRIAHVGWWERDLSTGRVSLSEEARRIFGVHPVALPEWHGRWLELIHPEDRPKAAEAAAAALRTGGPRYDVEYRVVRPDGTVRVVRSHGDVTWDHSGRPLSQFGVMQDITELRQAEQELRAGEARFRTFVDNANDGFFLLDINSIVLDVNRQGCANLGYSREELIGQHRSLFDPDLDQASIARLAQHRFTGETVTFETRHCRKDGTSFAVEVSVRAFEQGGRRFLALVRDITERKLAEDNLRQSEARFRTFVDNASDGFLLLDDRSTLVDVNRQACQSLGYSREELIGQHRSFFDIGLDRLSMQRLTQQILSGQPATFETRHRRKDGTSFPVEVRVRQLDQGARRFLALVRDITERKLAENKLRQSEERFRALVQFSFDVYWETDAEHRFTRQEFAEALADAPASGSEIGKTRWEVPYIEPDEEAWRRHRETLAAHLPFRDFELARPTEHGGRRYVSVSGLPMFDESGRFIGYRGVGRHITERRKAEEALRRSEAYLAEAQRLSNAGAFAFNEKGSIYWSEGTFRLWGFDPHEGIPDPEAVRQRIHPEDRARTRRQLDEALRQRLDYTVEYRVVLPDGTLKHFRSIGHPSYGTAGEPEVIGTTIDITERTRAQEERERLRQLETDLAHMNRLGIMGELTATLAHEILHPIATARNNARAGVRFLAMTPPDLGEVREALDCVVRDADRARDIVSRIREHIKKVPPRQEPVDLNEAINDVIDMVQNAIDRNKVLVSTNLMAPIALVRGDRVELQQVVLNLILNAVEAMSSLEDGARELSISTQLSHPNGIVVAVSDSGPGIGPEQLEEIFKPFYTTKTSGIGMGLSICRSIIDAHGGRLWAAANEPRGAIFQFTMPVAEAAS